MQKSAASQSQAKSRGPMWAGGQIVERDTGEASSAMLEFQRSREVLWVNFRAGRLYLVYNLKKSTLVPA